MTPSDPASLQKFLSRHGIRADKSFGQHFLVSLPVIEAILAEATGFLGILEIGPGPGVLTAHLSRLAQSLTFVELDVRMQSALLEAAPNAVAVFEDVLRTDLSRHLQPLPKPRAVVSNMPYNITGPLLERIVQAGEHWHRAVLMMQREVADRITALPGNGDRGALSVMVQADFAIRTVCQAPPEAFLPPPKVHSTVLTLEPRVNRPIGLEERLVRVGFSQPRKTLANNLIAGLRQDREVVARALQKAELRLNVRPHQLSEEHWIELSQALR